MAGRTTKGAEKLRRAREGRAVVRKYSKFSHEILRSSREIIFPRRRSFSSSLLCRFHHGTNSIPVFVRHRRSFARARNVPLKFSPLTSPLPFILILMTNRTIGVLRSPLRRRDRLKIVKGISLRGAFRNGERTALRSANRRRV